MSSSTPVRSRGTDEKEIILNKIEFESFDRQATICEASNEVMLNMF